MNVRIATRGSDLALWQARFVARALEEHGHACSLVVLKTRGDLIDDVPLTKVEGKAFFTAEIERALLDGSADLAVHSHKDLPSEAPPGLCIAAIPARGNAGERLLVRRERVDSAQAFLPLALGARVGTSAPRRAQQLLALRPDLALLDLRGNVPTRVERLRQGRYDAIVLAEAGLERLALELGDLESLALPQDWFVPAPAQGALAVQARAEDRALIEAVHSALHCPHSARLVAAERGVLVAAGGGCNLPLGAGFAADQDGFVARAFVGPGCGFEGARAGWYRQRAPTLQAAFDRLWNALTDETDNALARTGPLSGLRVSLVGAGNTASALAERLEFLGAGVIQEPVIAFERLAGTDLPAALGRLRDGDWIAVTSRHVAALLGDAPLPRGIRLAAVGRSTARALMERGLCADRVGRAGAHALACELKLEQGARVLYPCAEGAGLDLERELAQRGHPVERLELYRSVAIAGARLTREVDLRVLCSPSAVAAVLEGDAAALHPAPQAQKIEHVALGGTTGRALEAARVAHALIAPHADLEQDDLIEALVRHCARRVGCERVAIPEVRR